MQDLYRQKTIMGTGNFPGGPVAKTLCSLGSGLRFDPWSQDQVPHAATESSPAETEKRDPECHNEDLAQPNK